VIRYC